MAAAKKGRRGGGAAKNAAPNQSARSGSDVLLGGLYHNGRMYDPDKKKDQQDFKDLVEKGKLYPSGLTDKKEQQDAHKTELQRLADAGVIKGFGTKASAKKDGDTEDSGSSTQQLTEEELRERTGADEQGTGEE